MGWAGGRWGGEWGAAGSVLNGSVLPYWPGAQRGLEEQGDPLEYTQTAFF